MASAAPHQRTTFVIGTRKSALALAQTDLVCGALRKAFPQYDFTVTSKETAGDKSSIPLKEFTTKNLWTEGLEELLVDHQIDLIVHSLKDLPTNLPSSCALGAIMEREDPRDVLVVKQGLPKMTIDQLPAGSVVGTSSIRRTAQLARKYPHLKVMDVRGSVGTRLSKLDAEDSPFTAIILAAAGLHRLDLGGRVSQYLTSKTGNMLYAVSQGALGVELRNDDTVVKDMLNKIGHKQTTFACLAERSLLRTLEGGCSAPLGVETEWVSDPAGTEKLRMRAIVVSVDGKDSAEIEKDGEIDSAEAAEAFGEMAAKAVVESGGGKILEVIQANKKSLLPAPS